MAARKQQLADELAHIREKIPLETYAWLKMSLWIDEHLLGPVLFGYLFTRRVISSSFE